MKDILQHQSSTMKDIQHQSHPLWRTFFNIKIIHEEGHSSTSKSSTRKGILQHQSHPLWRTLLNIKVIHYEGHSSTSKSYTMEDILETQCHSRWRTFSKLSVSHDPLPQKNVVVNIFFFRIVSNFSILKTLTLLMQSGLFWCFHNRTNSDMDYRIFNVHKRGTSVYSLIRRTSVESAQIWLRRNCRVDAKPST